MKKIKLLLFLFGIFGISVFYNTFNVEANDTLKQQATEEYYYNLVSVDDVYEPDYLLENLSINIVDEYDGDVTGTLEYSMAEEYYTQVYNVDIVKNRTLGKYLLTVTGKDRSGNVGYLKIYFVVQDLQIPSLDTVNSVTNYELDVDDYTISDEMIKQNLVFSDNYYAQEDLTINIIEGSCDNQPLMGLEKRKVVVEVKDPSGNIGTEEITLEVVDKTAPEIIINNNDIDLSYKSNISLEEIITQANITVSDNYDQNITYTVKTDNYTTNIGKVGTYSVEIEATDASSNTSTAVLNVAITDSIPPVFFINTSKLYTSDQLLLAPSDVFNLVKLQKNLPADNYQIEVLKDDYSANYDKVGEYKYQLKVTNSSSSQVYDLVIAVNEASSSPKVSFFTKATRVFKKAINKIWKILKWPFKRFIDLFR